MQAAIHGREIRVFVSPQAAFRALQQAVAHCWGQITNPLRQTAATLMTHFVPTFGTFRVTETLPNTRLHQKWFAANHNGTTLHISIRQQWLATTLISQSKAIADATSFTLPDAGLTPSLDCYAVGQSRS